VTVSPFLLTSELLTGSVNHRKNDTTNSVRPTHQSTKARLYGAFSP